MTGPKLLHIIIIGSGRVGSYLANNLSGRSHSLVIVDIEERAFDNLNSDFSGFRVEGDAREYRVLEELGLERADLLIATSGDDNVNLMIAQIARQLFNVPRVIARVSHPRREEVFHEIGVETVCPTTVAGEMLLSRIDGNPEGDESP